MLKNVPMHVGLYLKSVPAYAGFSVATVWRMMPRKNLAASLSGMLLNV